MTTNWKEVAATLRVERQRPAEGYASQQRADVFNAAIRLCLLAAELPLGEAERVLEAARHNRTDKCSCDQQRTDPKCKAAAHD